MRSISGIGSVLMVLSLPAFCGSELSSPEPTRDEVLEGISQAPSRMQGLFVELKRNSWRLDDRVKIRELTPNGLINDVTERWHIDFRNGRVRMEDWGTVSFTKNFDLADEPGVGVLMKDLARSLSPRSKRGPARQARKLWRRMLDTRRIEILEHATHGVDIWDGTCSYTMNLLTKRSGGITSDTHLHMMRGALPLYAYYYHTEPWHEVLARDNSAYLGLRDRKGRKLATFAVTDVEDGIIDVRIGFDPERGYVPCYMEWRPSRQPQMEMDIVPMKVSEDLWIPGSSVNRTVRVREDGSSELGAVSLRTVIRWQIIEEFDPGTFILEFPPGCLVEDEVLGVEYTVGAPGGGDSEDGG